MAISFVAAGTEASGTSGTTITPALPSGIQAGDILIAVGACWDGAASVTMTSDWTRVGHGTGSTSFCSLGVFWHRYDGSTSPSGTITFSGSSGDGKVGGIAAFRGCKASGSPLNATSTITSGTSTTSISHGSLTTTVDNCFLVLCNGTDESDTRTLLSGYTNVFEDTTAGTDNSYRQTECSVSMMYKDQGTQGSTGTISVAGSALGGQWGQILALEPAATGLTLAADGGSYSLTGTNASLEFGREIIAGAGSYTLTGTAANLEYGYEVVANIGSYSFSGVDVSLEFGREILANSGSYSVSGVDANLEVGREVVADVGSYLVTGQDATLAIIVGIHADSGSYNLTGQNASLEFGRELVADAGSFGLTGTNAALELGKEVAADIGSYLLNGQAVILEHDKKLLAGLGSYVLTGQDAALNRFKYISADVGSFLLNGTEVGLIYGGGLDEEGALQNPLRFSLRSALRFAFEPDRDRYS